MHAPSDPVLQHVLCAHPGGLHRMAYWEWGERDNPAVVLCVHGLTRNGRDFDALATQLASQYRVICPDMPGRGHSDWLSDPMLYQVPQYVADCVTLIARLNVPTVSWVGTSMGGLIGMGLAALAGAPITRLLLNDVGPELAVQGLERICDFVGSDPLFPSFEHGARLMREWSSGFGALSDAQWQLLTRHTVVQRQGAWRLHYDPRIALPLAAMRDAMPDLWPFYDAIACPTWVVRGATSDLLSAATAAEMARRGPRARCFEVPDVGHAPTFIPEAQIALVQRFLAETPSGSVESV
jgi:pimeloyl-ACP methyl ester carboxylesterase